ncbi:MAG: NUDIX hydrolase [Chloroflexota bacterium]
MNEKILQSTQIFKGRIVDLSVHDVELPDGTQAKREMIKHPGAVAIVALDANNNVLLIRQFRLGADKVLVELPAGTLEPGEPAVTCAVRELREETGYRPGILDRVGGWYVAPGYTTEYIHLFIAADLTHDPIAGDADEFIEPFRVPFEQALAMVRNGEIENSTAVAGLLRAAAHLQF